MQPRRLEGHEAHEVKLFFFMTPFVLLLVLAASLAGAGPAVNSPPRLMLWAWERPEDLRFLDPGTTGVAYLAKTLYLTAGRAVSRPRLQPLRMPPGTFVTAVVRIESDTTRHTAAQRASIVDAIAVLAAKKDVSAVQVDFDAAVSERAFYSAVISDLHRRLPQQKPLSITALASWCSGDRWMAELPLAEAVPMLFRMGPDGAQILQSLKRGKDFAEPLCRNSIGVSTDEPAAPFLHTRRVYAFHPKPWTADAVQPFIRTLEPESAP